MSHSAFDSNGQLRSGLSSGSIFNSIGNYDQCNDASDQNKYCLSQINLTNQAVQLSLLTGLPPRTFSASSGGRTAKLGLCVPSSCSEVDLVWLINHLTEASLSITQIECHERVSNRSNQIGLVASILLLVLSVTVVSAATILDSTLKQDQQTQKRGLRIFVTSFSMIESFKKLAAKRKNILKQYNLNLLDGFRVLMISWIIVVHSYNFGVQWLLFDNIQQVDNVYKAIGTQWIANGTLSVDNFFLISGLLATLKIYCRLQDTTRDEFKQRKLSDVSIGSSRKKVNSQTQRSITLLETFSNILNRYLRLVPTLMVLILFSTNLLKHLGHGPQWTDATRMFDSWCQTKWLLNLFLIHNFIETPTMCFSHSWFVASDFQLFVVLQLLIYLLYKIKSTIGSRISIELWQILLGGMLICQVLVASIIYVNGLPAIPLIPADSTNSILQYYKLIYIKPYYWLSSNFLGAMAGLILVSSDNGRIKKLENRTVLIIQWIAFVSIVSLLMSTLPYFNEVLTMTSIQAAVYSFLARPLWSLSVISLLLISIILKKHNDFLGARLWLPLSKLSYCAYLIHPVIMAVFYGSRLETFQFDHLLLIYFTIGNIIITYAVSLVIFLFIETPIESLISLAINSTKFLFGVCTSTNNSPMELIGLSSRPR